MERDMSIVARTVGAGPASTALPALCDALLAGLRALADAGEPEPACRLAARACAALRQEPEAQAQWRHFNALLHRLALRTGPVGAAAPPA